MRAPSMPGIHSNIVFQTGTCLPSIPRCLILLDRFNNSVRARALIRSAKSQEQLEE